MMSNKWTFSLTVLITILALAFAVSPALAQDFDATFSAMDVSFAGDVQLEAADTDAATADGVTEGDITIYLTFGQVVDAAELVTDITTPAAKLFGIDALDAENTGGIVNVYNKFGALLDADSHTIRVAQRDLDPGTGERFDGKSYMITIAGLGRTPTALTDPVVDNTNPVKVEIFLAEGKIDNANPNEDKKNKKGGPFTINLVGPDPLVTDDTPLGSNPTVRAIQLANNLLVPDAGFTGDTFDIIVTLSEEPKEGKLTKDHFDVAKGTASDGVFLRKAAGFIPDAGAETYTTTGRDMMQYQYLVTITPKAEDGDLVIKLKSFEDQEMPTPNKYMPPVHELAYQEMWHKLTVKIKKASTTPKTAGVKFGLPKDKVIPAGGYFVVAEDKAGSSVHEPPGKIDESPKDHERTPAERMYNVIDDGDLPNIEAFLTNGGMIGVMGPHSLMITEIMWGSDASLDDPGKSQWIELYNAGAEYKTQDGGNTTYLVFYDGPTAPATGLHDTVGTVDATQGYWSIAGKGQSGRSGKGEKPADFGPIGATSPIISMNRVMDTTGTLAKGTLASSWVQSVPPSSNFEVNAPGVHIGSPGSMPTTFPEPPTPEPEPVATPPTPVAEADDIKITEIMVDTGSGRLPQWIELTNVSGAEVSLAGWSVEIMNADADADVIGKQIEFGFAADTTIGIGGGEDAGGTMGKVLLLVTRDARASSNLDGNRDRILDLSDVVDGKGNYKLISDMAFMIALVPPQKTGVLTYGDVAGNLDAAEAWEIPMDETGRSSLIRVTDAGVKAMGTVADGWLLASNTTLISGPTTWYGSDEDAGTPGYDGGGPLPVELSHFRPARDKATGAVVITWATQSELNNAGFFIKRSNQRDGQFQVINATMVAGAGTTSEKQFYTYTDTTAQPNVVYYYQIEDVSLDGQRQTLTNGIRLKGHIGAAGKLTSTWGELKSSNE